MGELERQDWREVLARYSIEQVVSALDYLMKNPPKMTLGDGSVQPYTGRPTVVNVTQAITEEAALRRMAENAERERQEIQDLQRRRDAGERFYGMADLSEAFKRLMESKTVQPSADREAELERQKEMLTKGAK